MSNGLKQEDPVRLLLEKDAVTATLNRLFRCTDEGRWPEVEACFAPAVVLDMTSVAGGEPESTTPREITDGWKDSLGRLEAVHHQAGNYEVKVHGDAAEASCYGTASHFLPNSSGRNVRTFVGTYDFHLRKSRGGWRIDRFRFNLKYVDGNLNLEDGDRIRE
jgi:hypothetical protein